MPVDPDFHSVWGTEGVAPPEAETGTRVLDPKSFSSQWLTDSSSKDIPTQNTDTAMSTANAALGNAIDAVPIVGPYIKSGTEKVAAKIRSKLYGTKYEDELANVRDYSSKSSEAHPVSATAGLVTGSVAPMIAGAGLAPKAFGLAGSLLEKAGYGALTGGLINGADSYVRTGNTKDAINDAVVGGTIGAALPTVSRGLGIAGRSLFGSADGAVQSLVQKANGMGIPIPFAQTSESPFVRKLSQMAGSLPGSGMGALSGEQQSAFNKAIANQFGESADRITPDVMSRAKSRIGNDFDSVAANSTIKFDPHLAGDLSGILHEADSVMDDSKLKVLHKQVGNILDKVTGAGEIEGDAYQGLTRKGTPLDRAMNDADSNVKHYAGKIRESLDDALERHAPPEMLQKLLGARSQYKAMKTVEDLVEKSPTGDVSAPLLMNLVRNSYGNMAYGGGGKMADLARIGQRFIKAPADSGTPTGMLALKLLGQAGLGLGGGAIAGYNSGYDPVSMAKGAALLPATVLGARGITTLLNRPAAVGSLLNRGSALVPAYNQMNEQP